MSKRGLRGFSLVEMMVATALLGVASMAALQLTQSSDMANRSGDLGLDFQTTMALAQQLLGTDLTCNKGFQNLDLSALIGAGTHVPLGTFPKNGNPLFKTSGSPFPPGLNYTKMEVDKILEKISATAYLVNVHVDAQKFGPGGSTLPGNSLYSKDLPMCAVLDTGANTVKTCGPASCASKQVTAIDAGTVMTCAMIDGAVQCWGSNQANYTGDQGNVASFPAPANFDALGDNNAVANSVTPVQVNGLTAGVVDTTPGVKELQMGQEYGCAMTKGGLMCWGANESGYLGQGFTSSGGKDPGTPNLPAAALPIKNYASGAEGSACALGKDGHVYCWGCNWTGELGRGWLPHDAPPHGSCGLGAVGSPGGPPLTAYSPDITTPADVLLYPGFPTKLTNIAQVAAGTGYALAISNTGDLYGWGECDTGTLLNSGSGQCGDVNPDLTTVIPPSPPGTHDRSFLYAINLTNPPVLPLTAPQGIGLFSKAPANIKMIAAGAYHVCVLTNAGRVYCWGRAGSGEIGNNNTSPPYQYDGSDATHAIQDITGFFPAPVTSIKSRWRHTCAELTTGDLYCWGANDFGEVGSGVPGTPVWKPTKIALPGPLMLDPPGGLAPYSGSQYGVGRYHTCAIVGESSVYCWGANGYDLAPPGNTTPVIGTVDLTKLWFQLGVSSPGYTTAPQLVQGI